jgi:tripartite-type tricarboxylate transporter receptor subunit TctC
MRWHRAYQGTVTNAKLGEVALIAECSRAVAIATWHAILESCASASAGGKFDTTARRVAAILGESVASIEAVFAALESLAMIREGLVCS